MSNTIRLNIQQCHSKEPPNSMYIYILNTVTKLPVNRFKIMLYTISYNDEYDIMELTQLQLIIIC